MKTDGVNPAPKIVKPFTTSKNIYLFVAIGVIIVIAGLFVGYSASKKKATSTGSTNTANSVTTSTTEAGLKDVSSIKGVEIKDATGTLQSGGSKGGVGSYHLDRPGGVTQVVYLTSTTIDLSPFVGKKVQVWGETQSGKNVYWFMDVVKIKVVQ